MEPKEWQELENFLVKRAPAISAWPKEKHACLGDPGLGVRWGAPHPNSSSGGPQGPAIPSLTWERKGHQVCWDPLPSGVTCSPAPISSHPLRCIPGWQAAALTACVRPEDVLGQAGCLCSFWSLFPSTRHHRPVLSHQGPERWVWRGWQASDWLPGCRGVREGEDFARGTWLSGLRS